MEKLLVGQATNEEALRSKTKIVCTLGPAKPRSRDYNLNRLQPKRRFKHGTISLTVLPCDKYLGLVRCRCENFAILGERKNVNLPGIVVDLPTLTEKDKEDIMQWGIRNKIDIVALSFVRKGSDLIQVRSLLGEHSKNIMLMSKVENQEGVVNFDSILANSDAFMVARGDLGMEIPVEKMFLAQKTMIKKANALGKPVVTATQMLESMIKSPRPTRADRRFKRRS
ncbi:unnamed protein product [Arabis nemorensis]|uniref:Pyruvate kinase n=1 Tax=Arabis nemorensis TaxID=586526 RepID=A0A565BWN4_9BRAS|nr:unnamed protein product [Arabis nemorensis]